MAIYREEETVKVNKLSTMKEADLPFQAERDGRIDIYYKSSNVSDNNSKLNECYTCLSIYKDGDTSGYVYDTFFEMMDDICSADNWKLVDIKIGVVNQ